MGVVAMRIEDKSKVLLMLMLMLVLVVVVVTLRSSWRVTSHWGYEIMRPDIDTSLFPRARCRQRRPTAQDTYFILMPMEVVDA